ncbi:MAG: hypothetical protein IPJ65_32930 [Archangiaceae bacterium]|nr:hypothetical protein [Archangiaceae bacterium]
MAEKNGTSLVRAHDAAELAQVDKSPDIDAARLALTQARLRLASATRALKSDLSWLQVPQKVTASVNRAPLLWLGGAFAVGALLGMITGGIPGRDDGDE